GAFRLMKNQQTMPSLHLPHQVQQVLHVLTARKSQFDVLSYKTRLESVEARDNDLVELRKKFKKDEKERDELKLKLENFPTSLKNLSKLLASQITDKTRLGYDNQVFNSTVFDSDELNSSESDITVPSSLMYD
nr:hypothetical protein [Tanacetum cinerariifolium]